MRFASAILPFTLLATSVVGQLTVLRGVLTDIQADVEVYGDAFTAGSGPDITASGNELLATAQAGIPIVQGATAIGLIEAIQLRTTIESLQVSVEDTYGTAVSQVAVVDALGLKAATQAAFIAQRATVATLGAALVSKVPALVRATAQGFVDEIDATIAAAIAAYA
ncbi:hypothetical protein B0T11DRAFT_134868 [Plectosphaerella cucumerina]|uniref:Uncharacterized protein n=1 Tax=Plectosphaerella cucumerina TaxID=40658 RepID=A0A8K0T7G6_9PEZI|nr:hypothetical protein B0T11DRAFT_134868 [Plectosphaerella cucumerina]